jgi:hypothetical protein
VCDLTAGFTTVTGPVGQIAEIAGDWERIRPSFSGISDPEFRALDIYDAEYSDNRCPAVLVIRHDPLLGSLVADRVDSAIRRRRPGADVVTEPGYYLEPVGAIADASGGGGGSVTVSLANLNRVRVPALAAAGGHAVAVIDTGDADASATVTDFTQGNGPRHVLPVDNNGHGSAVAAMIRTRNGAATIESLRVCTTGLAASVELFLALTFALWPRGRFDVVNVSMTTQLVGRCETQLGKTITAIADWCKVNGGGMGGPLLVAAVGNLPQKFGYPAAVEGAVIVEALDWSGSVAGYNTAPPTGVATSQASGGERAHGQTLGTVTVNGTTTDLVGTSFAAALVSAELTR